MADQLQAEPRTDFLPLSDAIVVAQIHETNAHRRSLDARQRIDALITRSPYTELVFAVEELMNGVAFREIDRVAVAIQAAPAATRLDAWAVRFPDPCVARSETSARVGTAIRVVVEDLSARAALPLAETISISLNGLELHVRATTGDRIHYAFSLTCGAPYVVVTRYLTAAAEQSGSRRVGR
ncbi:hypothetical protein [Microbacterium lacticum]